MMSPLHKAQPQRRPKGGQGLGFIYALGLALSALSSGCGATGPVVLTTLEAAARDADGAETPKRAAQAQLQLRLLEGRPTGLLLSMSAEAKLKHSPVATLALMRQLNNQEPITLHTLAITDELWQGLLSEDGLGLVDQQLEPGGRYRYWLALLDQGGASSAKSQEVAITWPKPAPQPGELSVHVESRQASVELSWASQGADGAIIFRRELGGQAPIRRLALVTPSQDHLYVDADVKPGGVYAYRIALASFVDGVPCFGPAGAERFVNVPELEPAPASAPSTAPETTPPAMPPPPEPEPHRRSDRPWITASEDATRTSSAR